MTNILNVLFAIIAFVTESVAADLGLYVHLRNLDSKNCQGTAVSFTQASVSLIGCVSRCHSKTSCKSVFYRTSDMHCTGCDSYYTDSSSLVVDSETVYFVPIDGDPACNTPVNYFRLCDGGGAGISDPKKGRVEIYYDELWWSLCDDCWDSSCATLNQDPVHNLNTVCGTFGLSGYSIHAYDYYGTNTKVPLIENVECTQTEDTIWDCQHIGPPNTIACGLHEALGVKCI